MAKTKRKQLAALAALKATSPESSRKPREGHQDGNDPAFNEQPNDKRSGSLEIRQQRIIFWIPPLDPSPRLVNSRSFRISGTPSRKRKLSSVNEEEKSSSDAEDGHVYKKYAKIILKLDSWNSEKNVDPPPPVDVPPLDASPVYAEKAYQRRKPVSRVLCKERVLSVLTDNRNLPASSSVPASKKTRFVDKHQHSLSAGDGGNANNLAAGDTITREPSSPFSRRLGLRTRKTVSLRDLVSDKSGRQELSSEQDTVSSRNPEKIASLISRRQKTKSLKDTVPQHSPTSAGLDVTSHPEDQRKLRSAEKVRIDPGLSAAGLRVQVSKGSELKRKLKAATRNTTALGTQKITTQATHDDLELASHSDSPSYRDGVMSVGRPSSKINNSSSRVSKVKLLRRASDSQGRVLSLPTPVARIRKRALTRTLGRRTSSALETASVQEVDALDDYRPDAAVPIALIDPVWNRITTGAGVPSVDEPNEQHHGSDVVTSSNNAPLNSRSRRISFLGKHAGSAEKDLTRVNLGSDLRRGKYTSHVNSVTTSGRANADGNNQSGAKSAEVATSSHYQNGGNGHIGNNQLRPKSGAAVIPLHHQNGDSGQNGSNQLRLMSGGAATSLHHYNGGNGYIGNNLLKAKPGGAATSLHHQNGNTQSRANLGGTAVSLYHRNGDNGHIELIRQGGGKQIKPQSRLLGSRVRNHDDVTAMVRSKLDEVGGLTEWLIGGGLGVFVDLFQERKIQEGDLMHLTMSSLKEIGVQAVGPRRKLIWMIEHLL